MVLKVVRCGRRVMGEARQRIIDPLRRKGRKGMGAVRIGKAIAVDDIVMGCRKVGHIEHIAQRELKGAFLRNRHRRIARDSEMHWHRRV